LSTRKIEKFSIAENQRRLRKASGISTPLLAKKLQFTRIAVRNYETEHNIPPLNKMSKIADFFGISADFLLLWDRIKYPRSIRLLSLAEKIDKMDVDKWHKVEATAATFLDEKNANREPQIIFDDPEAELTSSVHKNVRLLRSKVDYSQSKLGRYLSLSQNHISSYETGVSRPPAEKLILMSALFQTSIHAIATGRKLYFQFQNKDLKDTMLNADYYLSLEDKIFLCRMMEKIIEKSTSQSPAKTDYPRPLNSAESPSEGS